jgi:hypothetical protein
MARKTVDRKALRAQNDAAEAKEKAAKKKTASPAKAAKTTKAKKETAVKEAKEKPAKKVAKKATRKKAVKEVRLKAYWGVFNQGMKRLAVFEYADKRAAEKKATELSAGSKGTHFIQLVKEPITE